MLRPRSPSARSIRSSRVTRSDDGIPDYGSRGPTWYDALTKPDIMARGHQLVSDAAIGSTLANTRSSSLVNGRDGKPHYLRLSGTSCRRR
jgi:hypothetical protein